MHKNPELVIELKKQVEIKEKELNNLKDKLRAEMKLIPDGFELAKPGDIVKEGALGFEPYHGNWSKAGNSVGCKINEGGYVSHITHRGWIYANPI